MINYSLLEIAKILNTEYILRSDEIINNIITDSRNITISEHTIFIALSGKMHNGHTFLNNLYDKGIRNFIVSEKREYQTLFPEANFIIVNNTLEALQKLATHHRNLFNIPIIAITGSNGKTIIKEWLAQLLDNNVITKSPKSYNSQIGVPLSVLLLNKTSQIGIFEAGISQMDEMQKLHSIIKPQYGIFTNIGNAHQENFTSINQKINEKLKLFRNCRTLIYCKDHKHIHQEIHKQDFIKNVQLFSWSKYENADLTIDSIKKHEKKTNISALYKNKNLQITIPFTDNASIENAIHCWALSLILNTKSEVISEKMSLLSSIAMRLELKEGINNCTLINDSYNSDIESINIALDFLNHQKQHEKKTIILSDILQSGESSEILYKKVAQLIQPFNISKIIGIGPEIYSQKKVFPASSQFFTSTNKFLNKIKNLNFSDETILIKGARDFRFEKISNALQAKSHRTVLEVNLNAIKHNIDYFKTSIKPSTKIMAMVKAFSYGSGSFEIANLLEHNRIDYLGVAYIDEGIALRKAGIKLPIMVMNPEYQGLIQMTEYNLEPEIFSFTSLEQLLSKVKSKNITNYPIHIKIDTGMHRLGFLESEIDELITLIKKSSLKIKSVFSHLVGSDEKQYDDFTKIQTENFILVKNKFEKQFPYPMFFHILNSAGIQRFPQYQFNMVRLGIGMYGISTNSNPNLRNISTLKTSISQIKKIAKNETVGYNRNGKISKNSIIATIPIGYADGLNRKLSNGNGKLLVKGKFAPIIGNICMDMCMIDISNIEDVKEGEQVIIFGNDYPITELAKQLGTIPYEILTGISSRVKRIYYYE